MLQELSQADYGQVRPLFRPLEHLLFCAAVLAGRQAGRVFVDDCDHPRSALLITRETWGYLAGDPGNEAFNRALNRALFAHEIVPEGVPLLQLTCHPEDWGGQLAVVCHPRQPIAEPRRHHVCRALRYDWRRHIPAGFALQPIDETLLRHPGMHLPDDVRNLVEARAVATHPLEKGFGFVVTHGERIASYALVDCVVGKTGDIFFFTVEEYRRRGLGTVAAAATVAQGLSQGLAGITWDCAVQNAGSLRTAEKLGCERHRDYHMHYFLFDEGQHLVNLGWGLLAEGRYAEALDLGERAIALRDAPSLYAYYMAARAAAGLGEPDRALAYLQGAVERGWASLDALERAGEFEGLRGTPAWAAVLAGIERNSEEQRASEPA